ncbi:methionine/alanine import family NSS transporter small subunit [Microbacterium sp. zg.B48]|uniref:methionine/alanine import family NSS transporter small subunit n=1 Tax=unclassified Microbacterium TaxID=2609290 RepID=UPI00214C05CC|nr:MULTISPECIES: methionine/alanine import family NSS transporter small subunit [unclassified Microbacterium]MCR2763476.1 methionine/alanine import family NSS transporter small subunit [Microbacterium sp. zg.B48]MCR2809197.1 methionine/alanine import family NSS transporter small subunit [Microbacterium sp. zg.B185]WIM20344.1 methionine/alanine import family NSS transporter small subunit [Microbacterium sp. zg-B185]
MTPIAITFLILAIVVVWGGLVASTLYLRSRPELTDYPPGGIDDHRDDDAPIIHDT